MTIRLITGIPRSGTTLCCHIVNQQAGFVALHEPINPAKLKASTSVFEDLCTQITALKEAIFAGSEFEHGDKVGGLNISNPVAEKADAQSGKRLHAAKRGKLSLPELAGKEINLVVKQNALFTAYLGELKQQFDTVCITRNPIDVLLSWWTIDLPVSRGRLPAGENNSKALAQTLASGSIIERQIAIYEWFCESFHLQGATIVKYENIVDSDGKALLNALHIDGGHYQTIAYKQRVFTEDIKSKLRKHKDALLKINTQGLYSLNDISDAIDKVLCN